MRVFDKREVWGKFDDRGQIRENVGKSNELDRVFSKRGLGELISMNMLNFNMLQMGVD